MGPGKLVTVFFITFVFSFSCFQIAFILSLAGFLVTYYPEGCLQLIADCPRVFFESISFSVSSIILFSALSSLQEAVKGVIAGGLDIVSVTDITPTPHNGPKPKKARRLQPIFSLEKEQLIIVTIAIKSLLRFVKIITHILRQIVSFIRLIVLGHCKYQGMVPRYLQRPVLLSLEAA